MSRRASRQDDQPEAIALSTIDPLPPSPQGLSPRSADCSDFADPLAFQASNGTRIFATCAYTGAYNAAYNFFLEVKGNIRPLSFALPGTPEGKEAGADDFNGLVNPSLSEDGLKLSEFNKGRGIGDCGVSSEWTFDGEAFRLAAYSVMSECRGVSSDDWPVLFSLAPR